MRQRLLSSLELTGLTPPALPGHRRAPGLYYPLLPPILSAAAAFRREYRKRIPWKPANHPAKNLVLPDIHVDSAANFMDPLNG